MSVALETTGCPADGFAVVEEAGWLVLQERDVRRGDPLRDGFGLPGLWRSVPLGPGCFQRVFELPRFSARGGFYPEPYPEPYPDPDRDLDAELLDWAAATADGTLRGEPELPTAEEIQAWVPPERRRIRAGSRVAQVEVVCSPDRIALQVPVLVRIPQDLSKSREAWLASLCHDVQRGFRLVRFGIDDEGSCVRAEVDLTGAPSDSAPGLFELALASLQASASWVLPGLAFVADPRAESQLLDRMPRWGPPASTVPKTRNERRTGETR